jgi:hypothetical protein
MIMEDDLKTREQELAEALSDTNAALLELMACSTELLNSRVAKNLYRQCHEAVQKSSRLIAPRQLDAAKFHATTKWPL